MLVRFFYNGQNKSKDTITKIQDTNKLSAKGGSASGGQYSITNIQTDISFDY